MCSMCSIRLPAIVATACSLLVPSAAPGQVHVDPDGPAGKQYAAPLEQARQRASGKQGSAGVPGSSEVAPTFGLGIKPREASTHVELATTGRGQ